MSRGLAIVHGDSALCDFASQPQRLFRVARKAVRVIDDMADRDDGMSRGIVRINGDRAFEQVSPSDAALPRRGPSVLATAQEKLESLDVDFALLVGEPVFFADRQLQLQRGDDLFRELVLNRENIGKIAI